MNQTMREMMVRLGQFARNAQFFSSTGNGQMGLSPLLVQRNLYELEQLGYVVQTKTGYKLTQNGRNYIDGAGKPVQSARYVNANTGQIYVPPVISSNRPGADDNLSILSRGLSC